MHETDSESEKLQSLLDDSYSKAGSHLLSIHRPEWRLSAKGVSDNLKGVCVLNLATVNKSGQPIVSPVDGLFLGGSFWFGSANDSARFKHIRANPNVSAAYTLGEEISITIHGRAHEIDTASGSFERFHDYCREVYGPRYDKFGYRGNAPFAWIEPRQMYAVQMLHQEAGN